VRIIVRPLNRRAPNWHTCPSLIETHNGGAIMAVLDRPRFLTTEQAAEMLGIKPQTLAAWRCLRRGTLPYIRVGRSIRYNPEHIEKFLSQNTVCNADAADRA
jgi:excisionase family DNA binding protein